ncbi:MAG: tRNA adenosine(34) deaminase TadA [Firmicutes bacterium]|nr:tRNA adenosine(34) deaminase TadA [Bacillota bacterium]
MDESFMQEALKEARLAGEAGEIPVGAVIVKDGKIVGRGRNCAESTNDPTNHAEMMAIREACRNLGVWRLAGCEMYVTLEPCSMCAGAIVLARISKLYIGTVDPKSGACVSLSNITTDERLNHRVEQYVGLMQEDCSNILKDFFKKLRKRPKKNLEEIEK